MAELMEEIDPKTRIEMCISVLNEYSSLLDSYVLDFFTENHMEKLPGSWRNHIKLIPLEKFYYLMNLSTKSENVWPLSIMCLRVLINFLQLTRKPSSSPSINVIKSNKIDFTRMCDLDKIKSVSFEHPKLRNCFLKHVKPKKRYEIFKMAATTAETANKLNVKYVVDVGSGLGHLSRIMAYGFNLGVCSIETQSQLVKQAELLDCEFEKVSSKYLSEEEIRVLRSKRPVQVNQKITFNLTASNFVKSIKEAFSANEENFKFGIVGLHPCGDLAAVLLKIYTNCSEAKFISLVGCCYHKLTTSCDSELDTGFPLSDYCLKKIIKISSEARALACHAIETYRERLISKDYNHLKVHCYRAALEYIIYKNNPSHRKSALGNVKSAPDLSFSEYCRAALKKLDFSIPKEDEESEETLKNLSNWQDVVKFYSLRLMLAPLVETVVLLDRKIFLLEKGFQCGIFPAFDPEISPRNQLLVSHKY